MQYLQNLYQTCFKNGVVPQSWLYSTIQPIFKGSGSRQDPNNYRGITLQSCVAKAFCKILNNRITEFLQANNILHEEQNGFCTTRSCQDHISSLYFLIENRKLNNMDTYTLVLLILRKLLIPFLENYCGKSSPRLASGANY